MTGKLGQYQLLGELGRGGMAVVFLAVTRGPGGFTKLHVVKKLLKDLEQNHEFVSMFMDEARLAAVLSHPNICQTFEVGHDDNNCYMVMEYLDGQPFSSVLRRSADSDDPLPLTYHLRVLAEVLDALHYAHDKSDFEGTALGIVHRDVSPQNIFVVYQAGIKLLDFGIAKATSSSTDTRSGVYKGRVRCLAPEQVHSTGVDRRTDIFQVGLILHQVMTGKSFWPKTVQPMEVLNMLFSGMLPSVKEEDVHDNLDLLPVVRRALALSPDERYPTAQDFRADLEAAIARRGRVVTARDVGVRVAEMFAEERSNLRRRIQEALRSVTEEAKPVAEMLRSVQQGGGAPLSDAPTDLAETKVDVSVDFVEMPDLAQTPRSEALDVSQPGFVQSRGRTAGVIGAVVGALAIAGIVWLFLRPKAADTPPMVGSVESGTVSVASASAETADTAEAEVRAPVRVRIRIEAFPAQATISIDGVAQGSNPLVTDVEKNSRARLIRAVAPGHGDERVEAAFDMDRTIELTLKQTQARATVAATKPKPPSATATAVPTQAPPPSLPIREDR